MIASDLKIRIRTSGLVSWLLIPGVCVLELLFHFWAGGACTPSVLLSLIGISVFFGSLLNLIPALLPSKGARWFSGIALLLFAVIVMVQYISGQAFGYYMRPTRILTGADGVLTDYTDVVIAMILDNWWRILLALSPFLLILFFGGREEFPKKKKWRNLSAIGCFLGAGACAVGILMGRGGLSGFFSQYDFNAWVKEKGIALSMYMELSGRGNREDELILEIPTEAPEETIQPKETEQPETTKQTEPTGIAATEATEVPVEEKTYAPHILPELDFAALAENEKNPTLRSLCGYVAAQTPAMENDYTGLFKGKNLIFITAEAFNYTVIDPELTPTLYRLATQGIEFTNYYEPLWTGCTSGGELVNLSGLAMNCEMNVYSRQKPFNTIGRLLMNEGYFSRAYHNNAYTFYDRHLTHENLGYEEYIGMGNGMEQGVKNVWPQSDLEMIQFTLPQYIDHQPFSIYYMTVSGHCRYNRFGNAQSKKNWDLVEDLPYSDGVKAYIAANLELEKGLSELVSQLEQAGIADDTVIVMTADHYPYGLSTAWGNDHNGLAELYGVDHYDIFQRDKNTLIIWSGCLEGQGLKVDAPVCSVDILPTLSNLFGAAYDSRLSVGRDVLGTEEAISLWPDYSWMTELGQYDASKHTFTPFDGAEIPEGYEDRITATVTGKVKFSRLIQNSNFFTFLQKTLDSNQAAE